MSHIQVCFVLLHWKIGFNAVSESLVMNFISGKTLQDYEMKEYKTFNIENMLFWGVNLQFLPTKHQSYYTKKRYLNKSQINKCSKNNVLAPALVERMFSSIHCNWVLKWKHYFVVLLTSIQLSCKILLCVSLWMFAIINY